MPALNSVNRHYRVDRRRIARRVRSTIKRGESLNTYAKRTHVDQGALYKALYNGRSLGLLSLVRIARATRRSMDWLVGLR